KEKEEAALAKKAKAAKKVASDDEEDALEDVLDDEDFEEELEGDEDEDEEYSGSMSLATMEAVLMPKVLSMLDEFARVSKKIRDLQEKRLAAGMDDGKFTEKDQIKFKELRAQLMEIMLGVHFSNLRVEELMEKLYANNKRLLQLEAKLMRLAEAYGVSRRSYLEQYQGAEIDPEWADRVATLKE